MHPDIADLVSGYGDNFFITPAELNSTINAAQSAQGAVLITGNQTISGIKTFASRPTVNGTVILLSGEVATQLPNTIVYKTGDQTISGVKTFATKIEIGDFSNAIYVDDSDQSLVISGYQTTLRTLKLIAASPSYETSILFGPGADGLTFESPNYIFYDTRPKILDTGDFTYRAVALLDEVVLNTGDQTISGEKIFKGRIGIGESLYDFGFSNFESPATLQLADYGNSELRLGGGETDQKKTISFYDDSVINFQIVNDVANDFKNLHISGKEDRKVNFNNRPTVNGTGVLLSGEAVAVAQLPNTIVYTTGNQTIGGYKSFTGMGNILQIGGYSFLNGTYIGNTSLRAQNIYVGATSSTTINHILGLSTMPGNFQSAEVFANPVSTILNQNNVAFATGNQTISGVKTFASRPTVNGTGVLLSGDSLVTHIRPSGTNNVFVSSTALASTSSFSQNNIAVGVNALTANADGDDNVAMGHEALYSNTNGNGNIGIGRDALKNANGPDANICIGTQAGDTIQAGGSNIIIGHEADVDDAGRQRCIVLGRSATSPAIDGSLVIGGTAGNAMANLNVASAGAAAGEYLNIYINGVQRKIALLLP